MKKKLKILAAALAAVALTAFAGCSARSAVSAEDFEKQAKSAGYTVTAASGDSSGASKTLTAAKSGKPEQIIFHVFANGISAQNWYSAEKTELGGTAKTVVDSDNYNKCTLENGDIYYVLVRMDNTAVLCRVSPSNKSAADSFLKAIKY